MTAQQLIARLYDVPAGIDVVVIGRRQPIIGASIPETQLIPAGWHATSEAKIQRIPGYKRISFTVEQEK